MSELNKKIINATKWSAISELCAKLIAPISNMILARVLTPEAFGVVATLTMLITFAEIFTDAGFQQYIIQFEFKSDEEKYKTTNVAFISNLVMSFILWGIITIFRDQLATLVGNPGLGHVILSHICLNFYFQTSHSRYCRQSRPWKLYKHCFCSYNHSRFFQHTNGTL